MVVTLSDITTFLIWLQYEFHGDIPLLDQSYIDPEPEIESTPVLRSNVHASFSPQFPFAVLACTSVVLVPAERTSTLPRFIDKGTLKDAVALDAVFE